MLSKIRATVESGIISFLLFGSFALIYNRLPGRLSVFAIALIIIAHYLTAVFCGYWAGWRAKTFGWLYGVLGYLLSKVLILWLGLHAILPFSTNLKLIGYIPILMLLVFGSVIGEQRAAHYLSLNRREKIFYLALKRILDLVLSISILVMLSPIMLAIAISIKLASPGPVFFHQKRVGQHGIPIDIVKFRTMVHNADDIINRFQLLERQQKQTCQIKDDPRIFPLGKFLRTTSLDELPQLISVVKGEMSLVGPRPIVPDELGDLNGETLKRLKVKPGLTGLAQVSGRGDLTISERMEMDLRYIDNRSFSFDVKILLATILSVLKRHGAY